MSGGWRFHKLLINQDASPCPTHFMFIYTGKKYIYINSMLY